MARKNPRSDETSLDVSRRKFLAGAAVTGAAATAATSSVKAAPPAAGAAKIPSVVRPTAQQIAARSQRHHRSEADGRPRRLRLHGGRDQIARYRLLLLQSGIELSRHPRVADQLRQEHQARIHHLHARGIIGRDGARQFQGHGQAADGALPRHRRPDACNHGDLQRLGRPRAGHRRRRQRSRCGPSGARRADLSFGPGHQCAGARHHQMGRQPGIAAALRAIVRARLQDVDDAAL